MLPAKLAGPLVMSVILPDGSISQENISPTYMSAWKARWKAVSALLLNCWTASPLNTSFEALPPTRHSPSRGNDGFLGLLCVTVLAVIPAHTFQQNFHIRTGLRQIFARNVEVVQREFLNILVKDRLHHFQSIAWKFPALAELCNRYFGFDYAILINAGVFGYDLAHWVHDDRFTGFIFACGRERDVGHR